MNADGTPEPIQPLSDGTVFAGLGLQTLPDGSVQYEPLVHDDCPRRKMTVLEGVLSTEKGLQDVLKLREGLLR